VLNRKPKLSWNASEISKWPSNCILRSNRPLSSSLSGLSLLSPLSSTFLPRRLPLRSGFMSDRRLASSSLSEFSMLELVEISESYWVALANLFSFLRPIRLEELDSMRFLYGIGLCMRSKSFCIFLSASSCPNSYRALVLLMISFDPSFLLYVPYPFG